MDTDESAIRLIYALLAIPSGFIGALAGHHFLEATAISNPPIQHFSPLGILAVVPRERRFPIPRVPTTQKNVEKPFLTAK